VMINIKPAGKKDLKKVVKLSESVFKSSFMRQLTMKEGSFKPSNVRLLFEGGKLASSVTVIPRKMYFDGLILPLAGIGGVATDPECRGKGYAGMLMKDAVNHMKRKGYALSILYPFMSSYYEQFGYRDILIPFKVIRQAKSHKLKVKYEIKNVIENELIKLKKIYDGFSRDKTGQVKRPLKYWKDVFKFRKEIRILGAYRDGKLVAYMLYGSIYKSWIKPAHAFKIYEFACEKNCKDLVHALAAATLKEARKAGFRKVFYDDAAGLEGLGGDTPLKNEKEEYCNIKYTKMYRICDFRKLMALLGVLFDRRLKKAGEKEGWKEYIGIKRVESDFQGSVTINLVKEKKLIVLDEGKFIEMALGLKNYGKERVLKLLFPVLKPVYWDFDYL
jgi:predicted N-acetyltransferase YhbS